MRTGNCWPLRMNWCEHGSMWRAPSWPPIAPSAAAGKLRSPDISDVEHHHSEFRRSERDPGCNGSDADPAIAAGAGSGHLDGILYLRRRESGAPGYGGHGLRPAGPGEVDTHDVQFHSVFEHSALHLDGATLRLSEVHPGFIHRIRGRLDRVLPRHRLPGDAGMAGGAGIFRCGAHDVVAGQHLLVVAETATGEVSDACLGHVVIR